MAQSKNSSTKRNSNKARGAQATSSRRKKAATEKETGPILDDRARNDILGVIFIVASLALLIAVITTSDALLARGFSTFLKLAFGVGAYIVPIALLAWSLSFFDRTDRPRPLRIGIGLALIFAAIITLVAILTPEVLTDKALLFERNVLLARGGYLGSGLAWLLLTLVGQRIGIVVLAGMVVAGLIVLGLSISRMVERVRDKRDERAEKQKLETNEDLTPTRLFNQRQKQNDEPAKTRVIEKNAAQPTRRLTRKQKSNQADNNEENKPLSKPIEETDVDQSGSVMIAPANASSSKEGYTLPDPAILSVTKQVDRSKKVHQNALADTAAELEDTLIEFGLSSKVVGWVAGPTVTMFKVQPGEGERVSRIVALQDDIALSLAAEAVRIFSPIPGTSLVGIEIPNKKREMVRLGDVIPSVKGGPLELAIGRDVEGDPIIADLAKMPHLLIAGTTGSGKSVMINAIVATLLMRTLPDEVRLIMVDPKRVELSGYNGIPHLYVPVVDEPRQAASALQWSVAEMDRRLKILAKTGAKNIGIFNKMVKDGKFEDRDEPPVSLPYLVIIIDELSDLMMVAKNDVEASITRIAQLGRAAGIHLIVATQRPASEVVTNQIKINITNRISFNVATSVDSRVILDQGGAEKLIGLGDMLYSRPEWGRPKRIQGCFVADDELNAIIDHLKEQGDPEYHEEILSTPLASSASGTASTGASAEADDPLLWDAADIVVETQMGSTSGLQRRLRVGYSRAGRIMDMLEAKGIVGPQEGSKPREVLMDADDIIALRAFEESDQSEEF